MTTVLAIIGGWFVLSIPVGILVGKFLRRGSR
jgi:hypothetical protein